MKIPSKQELLEKKKSEENLNFNNTVNISW